MYWSSTIGDCSCSLCPFSLSLLSCLLSENCLSPALSSSLSSGITFPLGNKCGPGGPLPLQLEHSRSFS